MHITSSTYKNIIFLNVSRTPLEEFTAQYTHSEHVFDTWVVQPFQSVENGIACTKTVHELQSCSQGTQKIQCYRSSFSLLDGKVVCRLSTTQKRVRCVGVYCEVDS